MPENWITAAEATEHGYAIRGRKSLAVQPEADDFIILYARDPQEVSAFLLDADHPGLSYSGSEEVVLEIDACQVGEKALLGEPGSALTSTAGEAPRA